MTVPTVKRGMKQRIVKCIGQSEFLSVSEWMIMWCAECRDIVEVCYYVFVLS